MSWCIPPFRPWASGENEIFKKKSSLAGTQVPVRTSRLRLWAQRLMAALPPQIQHIIDPHKKQYFAALSCQTGKRTVFSTHTMPLRIPYSR